MYHNVYAIFRCNDGEIEIAALRDQVESMIMDALGGSTTDLVATVEVDDWQELVVEVNALIDADARSIDAILMDLRFDNDDAWCDLLNVD